MKKYRYVIIAVIIFSIIKQILTANIPILVLPSQVYDDAVVYNSMYSIAGGHWLGDYTSNTLIKGAFFPLYMAVLNFLGLSYTHITTLIYTLACIYFIYAISGLFKNKNLLIPIFILLLFNPITYASWTFQRIYRNGTVCTQILFIFASIFLLYIKRNEKMRNLILPALIGGGALASLWQTKEDGIWIIPFIVVATLLTITLLIIENRKELKEKIKTISIKTVIIITPIIMLYLGNVMFGLLNNIKYHVFVTNEKSGGYIDKAIHAINSVKVEDEQHNYVSASRKKIEEVYKISPTLESIKDVLEVSLNAWDNNDIHPQDGEVDDGWFFWALKGAVEEKGYYANAQTSNEFYKNVYEEVTKAISDGKVETNRLVLGVVWRNHYFIDIFGHLSKILKYVINYDEVYTTHDASDMAKGIEEIQKVEDFTNDKAIYTGVSNENIEKMNKAVDRLNKISEIYHKTNKIILIISVICYVGLIIRTIFTKNKNIDLLLLTTAMALSMFLVVGGIAFVNMTTCYSIYYMYLVACYPLMTAFEVINICGFAESFVSRKEKIYES